MKPTVVRILALCASLLLASPRLSAFDNAPEATIPDISIAFPFGQEGEKVVTTTDVLISPGCLIPAGSAFLTIFLPPKPEDVDVKKATQKSTQELAYSRTVQLEKVETMTPAQKAAYDRATRDPWKSQMLFRAAMKQYRFDEMRLVFVPRGSNHTSLEAFNLPEGMLLGSVDGKVKILAIEKDSTGHRLGLVSGAAISKVNSTPIGSLEQFQKVYFAEKKAVFDAGKALELSVEMPGGAGPKTFSFAPPRKLNLNDFFSASDVSKEPSKKAPAEPAQPEDPMVAPSAP